MRVVCILGIFRLALTPARRGSGSLKMTEELATRSPKGTDPDGFAYVPLFCYGDGLENKPMSIPPQPNIRLVNTPDYREGYANSVQIRVSVWDFLLIFGRVQPQATNEVEVQNFQGLYLSPQQAKALLTILEQNVAQYEKTFGEIKLDPAMSKAPGQIH